MPLAPNLKKRIQNFWLGYLGFILFLFFLVSQSVRSILLSYQIQELKKEIHAEFEKKSELEMRRNQLLDLARIEKMAREELGFTAPQKGNVILIAVPKTQQ